MAESVKVIVRCRPMNAREAGLNCEKVLKINGNIAQCSISNPVEKSAPPKSFTFDGAYDEQSTTEQIYTDIGYPLVEGVTEGYNGTIFAYGQTGSGKSFSMQGLIQPDSQRGIIPRAFEHIFETIQVTEGSKFLVHASYVEIYNEEVRDLLGKDIKRKLDIKEHPEKGVYIQDLSKHICKNVPDCGKVMEKGWKNRSTGATLMNADSSRSHSIFTIHLERCETDSKGESRIRGAKLNLVDLAGSERQSKTGATGDRLKEATKINLSLSALGNVISALVDAKSTHIPYRDSKLTRLLQDSLGGNTKTLMVACLSPADNNYDETLSTLRYANRAKNIKNKPKINEDPKDAMIREFQEEIKRLKAMLKGELSLQINDTNTGSTKTNTVKESNKFDIEAEKNRLRKEYDKELQKMREELQIMRLSKEEVEEEMGKLREHYENRLQTLEQNKRKSDQGKYEQKVSGIQVTNGKLHSDEGKNDDNSDAGSGLSDAEDTGNINGSTQSNAFSRTGKKSNKVQNPNNAITDVQSSLNQSYENLVNGQNERTNNKSSRQRPPHSASFEEVSDGKDLTTKDIERKLTKSAHKNLQSGDGGREINGVIDNNEAKKRMMELEQKFQLVGGEETGNKELIEKRKRRMKYAEERYKKLKEAMALEGEDILVNIYDNINGELKTTRKKFLSEQNRAAILEHEIKDLQSEFESDRRDYLNTIREQEKELKYLQSIIEHIHPTLRRDCNYSSLVKVRSLARWDEDKQEWILPRMTLEKTKLPTPGQGKEYIEESEKYRVSYIPNNEGMNQNMKEFDSEDRLNEKLKSGANSKSSSTFVTNRALQLLQNAADMRGRVRNGPGSQSSNTNVLYRMDSSSSSTMTWSESNAGSSASLNEIGSEEEPTPIRRPVRLQSLTPLTPVKLNNKKSSRRPHP